MEQSNQQWRLKKVEDGSVFGPVDESTLISWANSAQVAPGDQVDKGDDAWVPAPSLPFLKMEYEAELSETEKYGPTTLGTLREFLTEGLIHDSTRVTHVPSKKVTPAGALLALKEAGAEKPASVVDQKASAPAEPQEGGKLPAVELAREQRIRQLEEDLKNLRREHEELLQKYRQLNQKMVSGRASNANF